MLLRKAFPFAVKADAEKAGRFTGRASVYGVKDYYGDVVMPGAFAKTIEANAGEIVVLNQHNPMDPIGKAALTDSDTALLADGQLVLDLPSAKDMHTRVLNGLVTGISIGYETVKESYTQGVRQLDEIRLMEISLVTFPANTFARVTDVKSAIELFNDERIAHLLVQVIPDIKAGRILSATNRSKISDIVQMLSDLLDATDPDKSTSAAEDAALNALMKRIRGLREE